MANRKRKFVAARPSDAGGTGADPAEDGPARHKELFCLRPENVDRRLYRPYRHRPHPGADRGMQNRRQHQPDCKAYQQYRDCVRAGRGGHQGGAGTDMAVTKIHPIKVNLKKALDYIENPDKTDEKCCSFRPMAVPMKRRI